MRQAFGGPLGGWLGDRASRRFPQHGRIVVCQISVASGIPFTLLLFKVPNSMSRDFFTKSFQVQCFADTLGLLKLSTFKALQVQGINLG